MSTNQAQHTLPDAALGYCLVTGAAGFVGHFLVQDLLNRGLRVRAMIHQHQLELEHPALDIVRCDIADSDSCMAACRDIDTIFHAAAFIAIMGGRGVSRSYRQHAYDVNVQGTANLLDAAVAHGCSRFVDISSTDVCFDGSENLQMQSSTAYALRRDVVYTQTKIRAEQLVLEANGHQGLLTCALRPNGIYGPGENIMMTKVVENLLAGNLVALIGGRGGRHDNICANNLNHALILAAKHLYPGSVVAGKPYFIGDGQLQREFDFLQPFIEGLGFKMPTISVPAALTRPPISAWQYLHFKLGLPEPPFVPHAVDKLTIDHAGSNSDAERDFGFTTVQDRDDAIHECVEYFRPRTLN